MYADIAGRRESSDAFTGNYHDTRVHITVPAFGAQVRRTSETSRTRLATVGPALRKIAGQRATKMHFLIGESYHIISLVTITYGNMQFQ
jgi:hypothetical protein